MLSVGAALPNSCLNGIPIDFAQLLQITAVLEIKRARVGKGEGPSTFLPFRPSHHLLQIGFQVQDRPLAAAVVGATKQQPTFSTFAELYAAVNPKSNGERALVAGYWLQEYRGVESFASAAAQKELTHLGHKIANITDAMNSMKNRKPMLMLQVKKSGVSRQARKLYKVSHEGVKRIQEMVGE